MEDLADVKCDKKVKKFLIPKPDIYDGSVASKAIPEMVLNHQ